MDGTNIGKARQEQSDILDPSGGRNPIPEEPESPPQRVTLSAARLSRARQVMFLVSVKQITERSSTGCRQEHCRVGDCAGRRR